MSGRGAVGTLVTLVFALTLLGGCSISASKDSQGHDKNVDIHTPLGSLSVHTDENDPKATGLSAYPGAQLRKDHEGDSGANVNISSSLFGVKVVALKYKSDDSPDKILSFYKKDMSKYGKVLDCTGGGFSFRYRANKDDDSEVTCEDTGSIHEYKEVLKVGTQKNQRVIAVRPSGNGSEFAMVYVRAWDDKSTM